MARRHRHRHSRRRRAAARPSRPRPALPPATSTRLPSSAKNTGSRASAPMRGGSGLQRACACSTGMRFMDHAPQFGQAGAAFGSGAQRQADLLGAGRLARRDRALRIASRPTPKQAQTTGPLAPSAMRRSLPARSDARSALRSHCGGASGWADEQRAFEPPVDERRGAIDAASPVDVFGQHRVAETAAARSSCQSIGPSLVANGMPEAVRRPRPAPTRCRPAARAGARDSAKPRQANSTGAIAAGVALASGCPENGSVARRDQVADRAPTRRFARSSGSARTASPRCWPSLSVDLEDAGAVRGLDAREAAVGEAEHASASAGCTSTNGSGRCAPSRGLMPVRVMVCHWSRTRPVLSTKRKVVARRVARAPAARAR